MFVTALQKLRNLWAAGQYRKALKLAASWHALGLHKRAITRGWAATVNPAIYIQLGFDPGTLYTAGLAAVAARYGLPAPPQGVNY